jgi:hypothetical protein
LIDIFPLPIFFCEIFSLHFRSLKIAKTKQVNGCPTPIDSSSTFLDRPILSDPSHSALFMGQKYQGNSSFDSQRWKTVLPYLKENEYKYIN